MTLHVVQNQDDPTGIVIIEQWETRVQYEKYLAWRTKRGDMALSPGTKVWPYTVSTLIGEGGMDQVCRAGDRETLR